MQEKREIKSIGVPYFEIQNENNEDKLMSYFTYSN